jgi:hypothetical protein
MEINDNSQIKFRRQLSWYEIQNFILKTHHYALSKIGTIHFIFPPSTSPRNIMCITQPPYSKGNKTVPGKVATTHTEDGHKQDT